MSLVLHNAVTVRCVETFVLPLLFDRTHDITALPAVHCSLNRLFGCYCVRKIQELGGSSMVRVALAETGRCDELDLRDQSAADQTLVAGSGYISIFLPAFR